MSRLAAVGLAALVLAGGGLTVQAQAGTNSSAVDLAPAEKFDSTHRWHLFYAGDPFSAWPLTDVFRWRAFDHPVWDFIYGDCEPPPDGGCAPPLEIQDWNVCVRFWARYPGHPKLFSFHGAKAARVPTAGSFEVYTGRTTVVIFGDRPFDRQAGTTLRRVGRSEPPDQLRPPTKGSLRGKLHCQRKYR